MSSLALLTVSKSTNVAGRATVCSPGPVQTADISVHGWQTPGMPACPSPHTTGWDRGHCAAHHPSPSCYNLYFSARASSSGLYIPGMVAACWETQTHSHGSLSSRHGSELLEFGSYVIMTWIRGQQKLFPQFGAGNMDTETHTDDSAQLGKKTRDVYRCGTVLVRDPSSPLPGRSHLVGNPEVGAQAGLNPHGGRSPAS